MKRLAPVMAALAFCAAFSASAEAKVSVGTLKCVSSGGIGYVVFSKKRFSCTFTPTGDRPRQYYSATITNYGLDVGITGKTVMAWAVAAQSADAYRPGVLAGNYIGVAVDGSIGVGGGGKALAGGWRNSITLQPLSAQAQAGLNLAIGVSGMKLR